MEFSFDICSTALTQEVISAFVKAHPKWVYSGKGGWFCLFVEDEPSSDAKSIEEFLIESIAKYGDEISYLIALDPMIKLRIGVFYNVEDHFVKTFGLSTGTIEKLHNLKVGFEISFFPTSSED